MAFNLYAADNPIQERQRTGFYSCVLKLFRLPPLESCMLRLQPKGQTHSPASFDSLGGTVRFQEQHRTSSLWLLL